MKDPGTPEGSLWNTAVSSEPGSAGRAAGSKQVHQELIDIGATISGTIQPTRMWNCLSKVCAGGAGRLELVKLVGSGCAPSLTSVDQLLEQELREQCLLLRLSQWFGSPCGCSRGALTPRKRRWQHRVLYFGICGVSPSWKAADWRLSELVGTTPLPEGCNPPRGVERILFISPGEWEGTEPSWALPRFGFSPPRGDLRSLQEELLVCSCPSITTHFVLRVPAVVSVKP